MQNGKLPVQIPNYLNKSKAGNKVLPSAPLSKMCCAGFVLEAPLHFQGKCVAVWAPFACHTCEGTTGAAGDGVHLGLLLLSHMQPCGITPHFYLYKWCKPVRLLPAWNPPSPPQTFPDPTWKASSALGVDFHLHIHPQWSFSLLQTLLAVMGRTNPPRIHFAFLCMHSSMGIFTWIS